MGEFYASAFIDFVARVTGYENICPDPSFCGCGLHSTGRGRCLIAHADAPRHPDPKPEQVVDLICDATLDRQAEWGGHLELSDDPARVGRTPQLARPRALAIRGETMSERRGLRRCPRPATAAR